MRHSPQTTGLFRLAGRSICPSGYLCWGGCPSLTRRRTRILKTIIRRIPLRLLHFPRAAILLLSLTVCGTQPGASGGGTVVAAAQPPVLSARRVELLDLSGVGSAQCPTGSVVTGGGCRCKTLGGSVFGARPVGNSYLCGCWPVAGRPEEGVEVTAICLSSSVAGTLQQGLVDDEATAELSSLRDAYRTRIELNQ